MGGPVGAPPSARGAATSIHDVARAAGVSTATVSRALRGMDRVSESTRERVRHAAQELHYVASPTAVSLASGKTHVVGIIVPFLERWFFARLIDAAELSLRSAGYHTLLFGVGTRHANRRLILDEQLLWKRIDGVLVLSADLDASELAVLADLRLPIVTVGVGLQSWPCVGIDNATTAQVATEHLLELGHRRIGYVGGNPAEDVHVATAVDRRAGFLRSLQCQGIAADPQLLLNSDWTVAGGLAAGERLLNLDVPPTAILAASDEMAIGVLCAARRAGRNVPADLSVAGIDDHQLAFTHDLTTVAQPVRDQGKLAGERLLQAMNGSSTGPQGSITLDTHLVVRGSTAPPSR